MKKIGLFLGVSASSGGMFQYSQSMLAAVAALPRASFSVVVAYTDPLWRQHIARYQVDSVYIDSGQWSIMLSKLWRGMGLSNRLWRLIAPLFHPVVRTLIQDQCNLWIFPAQDAWSYQAPVPSVGTIHDLMQHTAGFTYGIFGNTQVDRLYLETGVLGDTKTQQGFIDTLATIPLLYQPGERWVYSVATDVQGYLIEKCPLCARKQTFRK